MKLHDLGHVGLFDRHDLHQTVTSGTQDPIELIERADLLDRGVAVFVGADEDGQQHGSMVGSASDGLGTADRPGGPGFDDVGC